MKLTLCSWKRNVIWYLGNIIKIYKFCCLWLITLLTGKNEILEMICVIRHFRSSCLKHTYKLYLTEWTQMSLTVERNKNWYWLLYLANTMTFLKYEYIKLFIQIYWFRRILTSTIMNAQVVINIFRHSHPFHKLFCYYTFILQNHTAAFSCHIFLFLHTVFSSFLCHSFTHQVKENL
jgi:hypothetical protein